VVPLGSRHLRLNRANLWRDSVLYGAISRFSCAISTIAQVILASGISQKMSQLKKGLYDQLITRSVRDALEERNGPGVNASIDELEESDSPDYLARHLTRRIKTALRGLSGEERKRRQIELANGLLGFIHDRAESLETDVIEDPGKILRSIYSGPVPPLVQRRLSALLTC
jgi:hypothetical protein